MYTPPKKHVDKVRVDLQIERFSKLEKPTQSALNMVVVSADVQNKINAYRRACSKMEQDDFLEERHQSDRLGEFLGCRPHRQCHAHAIVDEGAPQVSRITGGTCMV